MGEEVRYDARHIHVLEGLEAVRKRPGMYVGSTSERGLHLMVLGVVDEAVNEVLAGRSGAVRVTLTTDGGVRVADYGPGVAFEPPEDDGGPGLQARLTQLHAGRPPGGRNRLSSPVGGILPAVVNALSARLTAEAHRAGVHWVQEYERGVALAPPTVAGHPATGSGDDDSGASGSRTTGTGTGTGTGTTLTFFPDADVFETVACSFPVLGERLMELAFLYRDLDISLTDERPASGPALLRFRCPGGVRDFVASLVAASGVFRFPEVIGFEREDPRMAGSLEVALAWNGTGQERLLGYANGRRTNEGGVHLEGFRHGLTSAVTTYARATGLLTATDPPVSPESIGSGLTAVVSVKLDHAEFAGSTHGLLAGDTVRVCVEEAVRDGVGRWLDSHPEQAARLVEGFGPTALDQR